MIGQSWTPGNEWVLKHGRLENISRNKKRGHIFLKAQVQIFFWFDVTNLIHFKREF